MAALVAVLAFCAAVAFAGQANTQKASSVKSAQEEQKARLLGAPEYDYLVISNHNADECLKALDGVAAIGKDVLKKYDWGCMAGDHTGYITVKAQNEEEALKVVPESLRSKARAIKLNKFTPEEIKAFHEPESRSK